MFTARTILDTARGSDARVGIGFVGDTQGAHRITSAAKRIGLGKPIIFNDPRRLVEALSSGEIDAAVRGNLDAHSTISAIKTIFSLDRIFRMALMQPRKGMIVLIGPVGVDEGWTVEDKIEMIDLGSRFLTNFNIEPKIGVLSGGRKGDRGRHPIVDKTLDDAEFIVRHFAGSGLDVKDCEILIENAILDRNLILAPDGISGNLIFRTLHFLGGWRALGAPVLNLEKVFIDTSRAKKSYIDSIALASAIAKMKR
ncbi:MAG: methanogenesis marker protein Mmp4/MtxX [Methanomassiliicoccales archaeon]|nr:methanogenesis marker protein Mmp4/MtxX [Methanomassiliicoccales archaeon]